MTRRHGAMIALSCLLLSSCRLLPTDTVATAPHGSPAARPGGTLTVGVTPPGGIDPVDAYEPVGKLISSTMCDTVVTLDPQTGQVREGLTRSLVFSPDGTTLTFKMRRGLRFNDGSKVSPNDIDYSYRVLHAKSTASYVRGLIDPFAAGIAASTGGKGKEDSVLADDVVSGKATQPIAQALNEADFQLFANRGNGGGVRALGEPALAPFSQAAYQRDPLAFARNPVCVGPYKLAQPYRPGDSAITLIRSTSYYAANVGFAEGGRSYLDRIVFRIYPTPELAYAAYVRGEVDVAAVPPSKAADARRFGPDLKSGPQTTVDFIGLPTGLDPYSDTRLRLALSLALDRTALAASLGPSAVPGTGFLPSALSIKPGPNGIRTSAAVAKDSKGASFDGCGSSTPARADLTAARAVLRSVKDKPAHLVLYVNDDGRYPALAQAAARQWHTGLGLDVVVTPMRWADYLQKASQGPGFDGAFHLGWATDAAAPVPMFNDAQAFLTPLFTGAGTSNWSHWSSTDFSFALDEDAAKATDVHDRGVLFTALEKQLCRELPMLPVAFSGPQWLIRTSRLAPARTVFLAQATGMPVLRELYAKH